MYILHPIDTIMEQINIEHLAHELFMESVNTGHKLSIERVEELCIPLIDTLNISDDERSLIAQYALRHGQYCIDAQEMMLSMGIMASGQWSDKAKLKLERFHIIPKEIKLAAPPLGGAWESEQVLFTNRHCQAIKTTTKKNNQTYHTIKYMISRDACFKVLTRAFNEDKYADYFSLKWQILEQYKRYTLKFEAYQEQLRTQVIVKEKDDKIDKLTKKIDKQTEMIGHQSEKIDHLTELGQQLLNYGKSADKKLDETNDKLNYMTDFMFNFAQAVLTTWVGSSVIKTQLQNLMTRYSATIALGHLKLSYLVAFVDGTQLKVYFCCTNFSDVSARLLKLSKRHKNVKMLHPQAICLISCEINTELAVIKGTQFPNIASITSTHDGKTKSFDIVLNNDKAAIDVYDSIVKDFRSKRLQSYQMRMDDMQEQGKIKLSEKVLTYLRDTDNTFFSTALPFCQEYLNCYVEKKDSKITYKAAERKGTVRADVGSKKLSDKVYMLHKIQSLVNIDDGKTVFNDMVRDGIITEQDKDDLKKIAEVEHVDVSSLHDPDDVSKLKSCIEKI